jgi:biopolymer transport protein ExbD
LKFKSRFRDDDEPVPTASMADITFLLIIFFMVSTVFDVSRGIQMRLPATTTQQDIKERNVTISIDEKQMLFLDGERAELRGLGKAVLGKLAGRPDGFVLIKSDQAVPYRRVVEVLDELLQVGISNIALPTEKAGT